MTTAPHDQTRGDSTPYIEDGASASLSRNEVASLCMKAARGAGMSWGLAEEAGFAAAWLVQHGINGPESSLCASRSGAGSDLERFVPDGNAGYVAGPGGPCTMSNRFGRNTLRPCGASRRHKSRPSLKIGKVDHPYS